MKTAILVDFDFYVRRRRVHLSTFLAEDEQLPLDDPEQVATDLWNHCIRHINRERRETDLYRILVYDCPPLSKKVFNPVSQKQLDLTQTIQFGFRTQVHKALVQKRSIALRLGSLSKIGRWVLRDEKKQKQLLSGKIRANELHEYDVRFQTPQKGVDMKIGLDIASLAYKRLVDRIVLVSGDADFVPAAKLARREGIDVVLDPMGQHIGEDLAEHVDGVNTTLNAFKPPQKPSPSLYTLE